MFVFNYYDFLGCDALRIKIDFIPSYKYGISKALITIVVCILINGSLSSFERFPFHVRKHVFVWCSYPTVLFYGITLNSLHR